MTPPSARACRRAARMIRVADDDFSWPDGLVRVGLNTFVMSETWGEGDEDVDWWSVSAVLELVGFSWVGDGWMSASRAAVGDALAACDLLVAGAEARDYEAVRRC